MRETVAKLVRCAFPMVKRETHLGAQAVAVQKLAYLGIAETEREPYRSFKESVLEQLQAKGYNAGQINVLPTGKPWEVYLYLVSYAFPLPSLPVVKNQCHEAYYEFYKALRGGGISEQKFHIPLHLSAQWEGKFDDLVVYGDQEAREIKEAFEVLLFGSVLRVLEIRDANGRLEYAYKKWIPPASRLEVLGTRREAVEMLRGDGRFRGSLLRTMQEREAGLSESQLRAYYWLLSYLRLGEEFPSKTPERTLVEEKLFKIHDRLAGPSKEVAELSLEHLPEHKQAEEAKARLGDNAEWVGTSPVLKGLEAWVSRA